MARPPTIGRDANIAGAFFAAAAKYPQKAAIIEPIGARGEAVRSITFAELAALTTTYANGLRAAGLQRGMKCVLFVPPSIDFFALTFALFQIGVAPVLIDPGIGAQQMGRCLTSVAVDGFIGVPKAHVFRLLYRRAFRLLRVSITVGRRLFWGGRTLYEVERLGATAAGGSTNDKSPTEAMTESDLAAILFTSGSTGPAKGVEYTHGTFQAQVAYLQSQYGYGPDEIDLPTFPLFALFDAALGMTAVIPRMDFTRPGSVDPREIVGRANRFGCTHMFGSPALLRRLAPSADPTGPRFTTMRRVITAGAPVSPDVLRGYARLLPAGAKIFTPYGATESLPVSSIDHDEILADTAEKTRQGAGVCVGRPLPGLDVRIIEISDEPIATWRDVRELPPHVVGEICVRGPIVTRAYHGLPDHTRLAKIVDGDAIWHRMGDVGYFDERGRLWMCGRKSQRVVVSKEAWERVAGPLPEKLPTGLARTRDADHLVLFTEPLESIAAQFPGVRRAALVGLGTRPMQTPVMCFELAGVATRDAFRANLASHIATAGIEHCLVHSGGFPVDVRHNAKIFREKLAIWAAKSIKTHR
ncbi:MAG: fatty acid CoA ligase family protein [Phycisphaerae bacterium]|nr:fatty acid CoA ligase family protein [Phycisphaerae bacterium]